MTKYNIRLESYEYRATIEIKLESKSTDTFRSAQTLKTSKTKLIHLSIVAYVYRNGCMYSSGQCIDLIRENWGHIAEIKELCEIWERWHLNTLRAGTNKQMEYLRSVDDGSRKPDWYDWACAELQKAGLYEDRGYKFGYEWLWEKIPGEVIKRIKEISSKGFYS